MYLRSFLPLFGAALFGLAISSVCGQGGINPTGTPAPTMKSLDQIETRTPVDVLHTPGDASNVFIIANPGSYYLSADLAVPGGKTGILIQASGVSLDLCGHNLSGGNISISCAKSGTTLTSIHLRNGTITGAISGIVTTGTDASSVTNFVIAVVPSTTGYGIATSNNWTLTDCVASSTQALQFSLGSGCTAVRCISQGGFDGFRLGANCVLRDCSATGAGDEGITAAGGVIENCVVSNCADGIYSGSGSGLVIRACSVTNSTAGNGITVRDGSVVENCAVSGNKGNGIFVSGVGCTITGNSCYANGTAGSTVYAGISVNGTSNRIEGNHLSTNVSRGIRLTGGNNFVVRNTVALSTVYNYEIPTGTAATNHVGVVVTPSNTAANTTNTGAGVNTTDPSANFSY